MIKLPLVALATIALIIFALVPSGEIILPTIVSVVSSADHQSLLAMAVAAPMIRKPRRYLGKADLQARYGWKSPISVDRAWKKYHTLPPPTIYRGRFPLWDEAVLDAHDVRALAKSTVVPSPEWKEARKQVLTARKHSREHRRTDMSQYFYENFPDCDVWLWPGTMPSSIRAIGNSEKGLEFLASFMAYLCQDDVKNVRELNFLLADLEKFKEHALRSDVEVGWTLDDWKDEVWGSNDWRLDAWRAIVKTFGRPVLH